MKKHIPNFLTCLNLVFGTLGCISMANGELDLGIMYVGISAVFDFLDGFAARMLNARSEIGKQLDSLADMVSFGVLPSIFMVNYIFQLQPGWDQLPYIGLLIAPFSAIRLAIFNLDESQSYSFKGLPTPANAIMITTLPYLTFEMNEVSASIITIVSAFLLVSKVKITALKFQSLSLKENFFKYLILLTSIIWIAVLGINGLPFLIPNYLIISILDNLFSKKENAIH
ncbi:MAG: CDP-diacylglycerol--serine O-phosphatidyltransferase [Cyclobacteriaceae bacterium]|jgi:CDP-diacylglycerol--serine O-phosphatidyltransferase